MIKYEEVKLGGKDTFSLFMNTVAYSTITYEGVVNFQRLYCRKLSLIEYIKFENLLVNYFLDILLLNPEVNLNNTTEIIIQSIKELYLEKFILCRLPVDADFEKESASILTVLNFLYSTRDRISESYSESSKIITKMMDDYTEVLTNNPFITTNVNGQYILNRRLIIETEIGDYSVDYKLQGHLNELLVAIVISWVLKRLNLLSEFWCIEGTYYEDNNGGFSL